MKIVKYRCHKCGKARWGNITRNGKEQNTELEVVKNECSLLQAVLVEVIFIDL